MARRPVPAATTKKTPRGMPRTAEEVIEIGKALTRQSRCLCGAAINIASTGQHVYDAHQDANKSTIITATKIDDAAKTTVPKNSELDFCWATGVGSVSVCVLLANQ